MIYKHHQVYLARFSNIFMSKWRRKQYQKKSYEGLKAWIGIRIVTCLAFAQVHVYVLIEF